MIAILFTPIFYNTLAMSKSSLPLWDMRFSPWRIRRLLSFDMSRHVFWQNIINVSMQSAASTFRVQEEVLRNDHLKAHFFLTLFLLTSFYLLLLHSLFPSLSHCPWKMVLSQTKHSSHSTRSGVLTERLWGGLTSGIWCHAVSTLYTVLLIPPCHSRLLSHFHPDLA